MDRNDTDDARWMRRANALARQGKADKDTSLTGCMLVRNRAVLAATRSQVGSWHGPTAPHESGTREAVQPVIATAACRLEAAWAKAPETRLKPLAPLRVASAPVPGTQTDRCGGDPK